MSTKKGKLSKSERKELRHKYSRIAQRQAIKEAIYGQFITMPVVFDYHYAIENRGVEEVFDGIVQWLKNNKGRIQNAERPFIIRATHGSHATVQGFKKNAKKNLEFHLSKTESGTHVDVVASPARINRGDVNLMKMDAATNWGLLLEEIWSAIGDLNSKARIDEIIAERKRLAAIASETAKSMIRKGIISSILIFAIGMTIFLIAQPVDDSTRRIFQIGITVATFVGALPLIYGLTKMLSYRRYLNQ